MRHTLPRLLVAAGLLAVVTACESSPTDSEGSAQTEGPDAANETAAVTATAQPGDVIASREVEVNGTNLRVDVTGLSRQGETVLLVWTIANLDEERWLVGDTMGVRPANSTVGGTSLVDPVNSKRYRVARAGSEDGACVCTRGTDYYVDPGASREFNATFGAPPPEVTHLNVDIQGVAVITDVPVS